MGFVNKNLGKSIQNFGCALVLQGKRLPSWKSVLNMQGNLMVIRSMPALLVKTVVKLDNGNKDKGLGSGDKDLGLVVVATKSVGPLIIHLNSGYAFVGNNFDPALEDYVIYGLAGEYSVTEKLKLMIELYGESDSHFDVDAFKHHDLQTLLGSTYQLTERIVFDAAIKVGLTDDSPDYGLTAGVSIGF